MENKKPNYPIKWEVKSHNYQIAATGDYDGYWEITNGRDSLITKDDYEDIDKDLQELVDLLNNTYPNFTVDRGNEAALDAENKFLRQEMEDMKKAQPGPRWVKAADRLPGWAKFVEWRHESKVSAGKDTVLGIAKRGIEYFRTLEWLDESTPAGMEEELKAEIERRTKLLEDDLKRDCRLNMPSISEQEQEATWQAYKKRHNL
jgi:hypothetical protein